MKYSPEKESTWFSQLLLELITKEELIGIMVIKSNCLDRLTKTLIGALHLKIEQS
jgi:hypothetical protein